jgi:hypothetical protein
MSMRLLLLVKVQIWPFRSVDKMYCVKLSPGSTSQVRGGARRDTLDHERGASHLSALSSLNGSGLTVYTFLSPISHQKQDGLQAFSTWRK